MAATTLMSVPAEIRLSIFRQLFSGSEVTIYPWYDTQAIDQQLHLDIFSTCKQAYREARPVASTIKSFYFPLIQRITVDALHMAMDDLRMFTSLKQLRLTHVYGPEELGYYEVQETLRSEKAVTSLLRGALDKKLVNTAKTALLAKGVSWQTDAYFEPGRSFEIIDTLKVAWDVEAGENYGLGSMRVTYNLDTKEVCKRSARCEFNPVGLEEIWKDGWTKTWKIPMSGNVCIGKVPRRRNIPPLKNSELEKVTLASTWSG